MFQNELFISPPPPFQFLISTEVFLTSADIIFIQEANKGGLRILALDGGGIKGLVLTKVLAEIQTASKVNTL